MSKKNMTLLLSGSVMKRKVHVGCGHGVLFEFFF